jgi:hypothetical protein
MFRLVEGRAACPCLVHYCTIGGCDSIQAVLHMLFTDNMISSGWCYSLPAAKEQRFCSLGLWGFGLFHNNKTVLAALVTRDMKTVLAASQHMVRCATLWREVLDCWFRHEAGANLAP